MGPARYEVVPKLYHGLGDLIEATNDYQEAKRIARKADNLYLYGAAIIDLEERSVDMRQDGKGPYTLVRDVDGRVISPPIKEGAMMSNGMIRAIGHLTDVETYDNTLNDEEVAPTGDDYNAILSSALAALEVLRQLQLEEVNAREET